MVKIRVKNKNYVQEIPQLALAWGLNPRTAGTPNIRSSTKFVYYCIKGFSTFKVKAIQISKSNIYFQNVKFTCQIFCRCL